MRTEILLILYKRTNLKAILVSFLLLFLFPTLAQEPVKTQKVGLVLSGGGAAGFAHIGVLKALEENGIPIDYITGTSAGALIGSLYAVGYSPEEIESFVSQPDFMLMTRGDLRPDQQYYIREDDPNASMFEFTFSQDSILQKSLPTSLTNSTFLDYEMMRLLGAPAAYLGNDFDSLFVPFRCLASDIVDKKNIVFSDGYLNEAVRASMTFPFYFHPLEIDGRVLFDGGLYNNFPADVMYQDFNPDYIIGSNVSYNAAKPNAYDPISQLINMMVSYSNFTLPCENGIIITPELKINTFDFESAQEAIRVGYETGLRYVDSILPHLEKTVAPAEIVQKRLAFKQKIGPFIIREIDVVDPDKSSYFVKKSLRISKKDSVISEEDFQLRYYRLAATKQIDFMFPVLEQHEKGGLSLDMSIKKSNEFKVEVGGHISSRPVNTGFVGLTYSRIGRIATKLHAESYFGKFYGSVNTNLKVEFPSKLPLTIEPYFNMNRWDYFRSFATFFEDVRPSFLVQNESYFGLKVYHPITNNIKITYDGRQFMNQDNYYQTEKFVLGDTSDVTTFKGFTSSIALEKNSLNRKQFASSGHYLGLKFRFVQGTERSISGSTAPEPYSQTKLHEWINLNLDAQSFIIDKPAFHFGLQGQATFNSQSLFANYTATILNLSSFNVNPDAATFFLPEYRSPLFFGVGTNTIFTVRKSVDIRGDIFFFQPFAQLIENEDGTFGYSVPFKGDAILASGSVIWNSFLGPVRFTLNYFPRQEKQLYFQFSFGYVLFNERAIR